MRQIAHHITPLTPSRDLMSSAIRHPNPAPPVRAIPHEPCGEGDGKSDLAGISGSMPVGVGTGYPG